MSTKLFVLLFIVSLLAGAAAAQGELPPLFQPAPRPLPSSIETEAGLRLEYSFVSLTQGGSGLLRLTGAEINSARFEFRGEVQPFFVLDGVWYALIAVEMNAPAGIYGLRVDARRGTETVSFRRDLRIDSANFILQAFDLPAARANLLDGAVEAAEFDRLAALTAESAPEPLWDAAGFELPLDSPLTSPFGSFRLLNGARETRHTGWDQVAPVGAPIRAIAAGRVVFADRLEIRGNTVLIDHGLGIFSSYAHFSDFTVRAGQRVAAGQIIGSSGDSGRSSGPHLHWEIVLGGRWVDGVSFLDLWLPA